MYLCILDVYKVLVAFRGDKFSHCVDLGSIHLLVWAFPRLCLYNIGVSGFVCLSGVACDWDLLLLLWRRLTAETLLSFSFFSTELSLTSLNHAWHFHHLISFYPVCANLQYLQNFPYRIHERQSLSAVVSSCWNIPGCILLSTSHVHCCLVWPVYTKIHMYALGWFDSNSYSCLWQFTHSLWRCFTSTHLKLILFGCSAFWLTWTSPHMHALHVFGTQLCLQKKLKRKQVEVKFIEILTSRFVFCWFSSG